MDLGQLIKNPGQLDRETLYSLRSLVALHPYHQAARLLMLQNLYLLHSPSFDEELRKAAIYITDRKTLFNLVEAAHYRLRPASNEQAQHPTPHQEGSAPGTSRTISLINDYLDTLPAEEPQAESKPKRKPTPADAAIDYVSYLMESEDEDENKHEEHSPQLKGQDLIDNFINQDGGKIELKETPEYLPQIDNDDSDSEDSNEGIFTETLARIYIKQGRYSKALEIIKRINLKYPKKNIYFADQIRFLEKLIINNNYK